jgi:hypothetical protein
MTDEERRWIAGIATPKGGPIGPAYGIVAGLQIVTLDHGWGFGAPPLRRCHTEERIQGRILGRRRRPGCAL